MNDSFVQKEDKPSVKTMIIFIGIQGSGKTHYYNKYLDGIYEHVNLDELQTRNKERILIRQLIAEEKSFVVDNTNPQIEDRMRYIVPAKEAGYHIIGYFFESKVQDCIRRNNLREGKERLLAKAIAATSNKLQLPSRSEGFDELYFIEHCEDNRMKKSDWRE